MGNLPDHIALRGLGYQEDGVWVALALEMDLRGYGETFEEAFKDLQDQVRMQLSFAREKNDPGLIFKDAEKKYFEIYERCRRDVLAEMAGGTPSKKKRQGFIGDLTLPELMGQNKNNSRSIWAHAAA